jgi:hypothetical protein
MSTVVRSIGRSCAAAVFLLFIAATSAANAQIWTGTFDLADVDLVLQSTREKKAADFARTYNQVRSGFNGGNWLGTGITSSIAATNPRADTGISVADNALLGLVHFGGWAVDANSILLKYTYYGDIDQNGQVDADDLTVFASNFGRIVAATQIDGDIDFNGAVNADDLTVFANNFNKGVGNPLAVASGGVRAVPEPSSVLLAGLGLGGILAACRLWPRSALGRTSRATTRS